MMFSCLFGVGYVVVRYRKSGFLKRLHATPLTAFEFLSAQVLSRLLLILFVTASCTSASAPSSASTTPAASAADPGGAPGRALDDRAGTDHRRALLQRGAGRGAAEPAHLADDAAVGHLVLAGRFTALGAVDRAYLPAHACARCRPRRHARWRGAARHIAPICCIWPRLRSPSSPSAPGRSAGASTERPTFREPRLRFLSDNTSTACPEILAALAGGKPRPGPATAMTHGRSAWSALQRLLRHPGARLRRHHRHRRQFPEPRHAQPALWRDLCAPRGAHRDRRMRGTGFLLRRRADRAAGRGARRASRRKGSRRHSHHLRQRYLHSVQPAALSLTQATEHGTVYRPAESRA